MEMPVKTDLVLAGEKINNGLVSFEERKASLQVLRESAQGLKINGVEDKAGLLAVSSKRKELKAARVSIEKEGKQLRDHITVISKNISAKEKELVEIIEPCEDELQKEEDRIAAEKKKIEDDKAEVERLRIQGRIDALAAFGYAIKIETITSIDDETFAVVLNDAKNQHEKELANKAEEERLKKEVEEKLIAERKELEELREKNAAAQRIIDTENARIKKEQDDKAAELLAAQKKIDDEKAAIEMKKQKEIDDKLAAEKLEQAQKDAAEKERLRLIEVEKQKKINEAEKLAQASDKDKFQNVIDQLSAITIPAMEAERSKQLAIGVKILIEKITNHILENTK